MNRTKDIIVTAFWQLLDEKPFNQITVKDIVTRCQVNRNTFYYHFHDIPELVEYSIKEDVDSIMSSSSQFESLSDCILPFIRYSHEKKRAILHIYRSVEREIFLQLLEQLAMYIVKIYVDTVGAEVSLSDEDKDLLIHFYKSLLIGLTMDWFDHSMDYDLGETISRIKQLFLSFGLHGFF